MPEETSTSSAAQSVEEKPCSSTSASDSGTEVLEEAKKLIGTGNRHLVMGDVVSAVAVFQDACSMLAARYGDTADECGEALFLCGKSLLELARMENTVLGNALEGVPEEEEGDDEDEEKPSNPNIESANNLDAETREQLRRQVYEAMAEEEKPDAKQNPDCTEENGDASAAVKEETSNGAENSSNAKEEGLKSPVKGLEEEGSEPCADVEEESEDGGEQEDDDDDDDDDDDEQGEKNGEEEEVGNLQLAWEMLEVAKVIYKRKESKEDQLMAAQAHLKLGEVGTESGNYPQALEDFQECLSLQLKHLPPHSRLLAETHYHVATTLCYMDQYPMAIQHYNSSVAVIEARLAMLQEVIDKASGEEAASEKSELEELRLLLPEIREKVEDAKESQRTATAASRAIQQTLGGASTSSGFSENGSSSSSAFGASQIPVKPATSSSSTVTDISHLVRKKRKLDEDSAVEDSGTKQAKQEVNGNANSSSEQQESSSTETAA